MQGLVGSHDQVLTAGMSRSDMRNFWVMPSKEGSEIVSITATPCWLEWGLGGAPS